MSYYCRTEESNFEDGVDFDDVFDLPDPIKVRKAHKCDHCNIIIKKGELAIFQSGRAPVYKEAPIGDPWRDGQQIGIEYWKSYIHEDSSVCDKANERKVIDG